MGSYVRIAAGAMTFAATFVLAVGPVVVLPAQAAITAKVKQACVSDYKRLCPKYKVGSTQLRACMEAKQSEISWECVSALIDAGEVDRTRAARR